MSRVPETRTSLILRLPSADDAEAWREFVSIYEPFVYRYARRGGLQDADAREVVQNVMVSVARAVGRWNPDVRQGRFRTWLFRIARNHLVDELARRGRQPCLHDGTTLVGALDAHLASDGAADHELQSEHRRELFRWAAERVKGCVRESTWQAFWMTAIEDRPAEHVAELLGLTPGAVYIARSRVLARLRDEVLKWENGDDDAV